MIICQVNGAAVISTPVGNALYLKNPNKYNPVTASVDARALNNTGGTAHGSCFFKLIQ